jgi:hypothetical protein
MSLAEEAQLYLAVVDAFRAEGCEPHWRPERPMAPIQPPELGAPAQTRRKS